MNRRSFFATLAGAAAAAKTLGPRTSAAIPELPAPEPPIGAVYLEQKTKEFFELWIDPPTELRNRHGVTVGMIFSNPLKWRLHRVRPVTETPPMRKHYYEIFTTAALVRVENIHPKVAAALPTTGEAIALMEGEQWAWLVEDDRVNFREATQTTHWIFRPLPVINYRLID